LNFGAKEQGEMVDAAERTAVHSVTMNGVPFDLSNDKEFEMLLEDLLRGGLREHPEALKYARHRTKAWLKAYALVSELERQGLLRGGS
jgi:hypothetical protein